MKSHYYYALPLVEWSHIIMQGMVMNLYSYVGLINYAYLKTEWQVILEDGVLFVGLEV